MIQTVQDVSNKLRHANVIRRNLKLHKRAGQKHFDANFGAVNKT